MRVNVTGCGGLDLAKRMIFLAWKASRCLGMGVFQDRGQQDEEAVWAQAYDRKDYPGGRTFANLKEGEVHGDYVFGRMVKLYLKFGDTWVEIPDGTPRPDYQPWYSNYPTYTALAQAAAQSLEAGCKEE